MPPHQMVHPLVAIAALFGALRASAHSLVSPITGWEGLYQTEDSEVTDVQLPSDAQLPGAPEWLVGNFMLGGGHKFEMGDTHFNHAFDAFGRVMRFHLQPVGDRIKCKFSARMFPSEYYLKSKAAGTVVPAARFEDTTPHTNTILGPVFGPADNIYVQQHYFAGRYWSSTDAAPTITYNESLGDFQTVKWEDWLLLVLSVAHTIVLPDSGKMVGLGSRPEMLPIPFQKSKMILYEIDQSDLQRRVELFSFDVEKMLYEHSFGFGGNYAVICEHPYHFNPLKLSSGLLAASDLDFKGNTTFHLVDLRTKNVEKFVAPPYFIYHFANLHQEANGDIVFAQPTMYGCNEYTLFHMQTANSPEVIKRWHDTCDLSLVQFTLHRSWDSSLAGTVTAERLDGGSMEFPKFNELWRGRAACYIYMFETFHNSTTEYYSMALVKFDLCKRVRAAEWAVRGHFPGEPKFIPRPGAVDEDDGVVVTVVLDGGKRTSYLLVLDGRTMRPLDRFDIGRHVPISLHGAWHFDGADSLKSAGSLPLYV